jgi:hypothetical protein
VTHLNVTSRQIVNLSTECISTSTPERLFQPFYYDRRATVPFPVIPQGFSFVITDINITVCPNRFFPNSTDYYFAVVNIGDGSRQFTVDFHRSFARHYSLAGGLVVPEGIALTASNAPSSSDALNVQVLGYFVRGPGLSEGEPFIAPE